MRIHWGWKGIKKTSCKLIKTFSWIKTSFQVKYFCFQSLWVLTVSPPSNALTRTMVRFELKPTVTTQLSHPSTPSQSNSDQYTITPSPTGINYPSLSEDPLITCSLSGNPSITCPSITCSPEHFPLHTLATEEAPQPSAWWLDLFSFNVCQITAFYSLNSL